MTSTSLHDPTALNTTLAELPPLPMAALMIGVYNLLQEGADLPQPCYVSVSQTGQQIDMQFPGKQRQPAGHHRVGAPLRQRRDHGPAPRRARPVHPRRRDVRLLRPDRQDLRLHPGRTGQHLADQENPPCTTATTSTRIADTITTWEVAAQQLPLTDLTEIVADLPARPGARPERLPRPVRRPPGPRVRRRPHAGGTQPPGARPERLPRPVRRPPGPRVRRGPQRSPRGHRPAGHGHGDLHPGHQPARPPDGAAELTPQCRA